MKYLDEYRDADLAQKIVAEIRHITTRPWAIMEICGGQTHAILKFGIDEFLPGHISLIHGPGCPVCVTPVEITEQALKIAARPEVIFCSFGDMLRVPGHTSDLLSVKANGGRVRIVYSPLDAITVAEQNADCEVVFFAVGFETTAPATALAVQLAAQRRIQNFSLLVSHVLVPPAMEALLSSPERCVQGFLAAGHVCAIAGCEEYVPIARKYHVPVVVTGFEPLDILEGILMCVRQLESGRAEVENQYARAVRHQGNRAAQLLMQKVFRVVPRKWRGLGEIPRSGLALCEAYAVFDAALKFNVSREEMNESPDCLAGLVLQGRIRPAACPAFANRCTPEHPLGALMVSSEGACAAYYRYRGRDQNRGAKGVFS